MLKLELRLIEEVYPSCHQEQCKIFQMLTALVELRLPGMAWIWVSHFQFVYRNHIYHRTKGKWPIQTTKKFVKWLYFCKSTLFLESIVLSLKESDKLSDYDISCNKENLFVWSKRNQYKKLLKFLFFPFLFCSSLYMGFRNADSTWRMTVIYAEAWPR